MSHKLQFIENATARRANISALCREYGISRQTGHKGSGGRGPCGSAKPGAS
ncbi:MAG TPA: hypothetical protein VLT82_13330 [Myxococcaceae bacterium]|nr:hypothetical protein [Myxococcaceae bacterium]